MDQGVSGRNRWCSINREIVNHNINWSDTTEGDCISVQFVNQSQFSKTPCTNKLNYICEVNPPLANILLCHSTNL